MKRMLINAQSEELRVAIVQDGLLVDLDIERPDVEQKKSNIYKGRISSIEPSLNAVFVDYGSERHGFLPVKEIAKEYFQLSDDNQLRNIDIQKALRIGQEVIIQVDKEERGTKGAALTTFISLAGSYLVLMPNNPRAGGISRRIEGDEREELRERLNTLNIPEGMGIIIRTAGVTRSAQELQWDLAFLLRYWDAINQAAALKKAPYLIHQESDVIIRAIRDNLRHDVAEIIIDKTTAFDHVKNYLEQIRPDFVDRIKIYSESLPLFSYLQVERQIEMAYQREVQLPSGGSIFIDLTEALVSIDVNSAKATRGGNIEETAFHTNLEAAEEIARQLRIRDIGGLVVIDFIDMTNPKNQRDVENRLRDCLQMDRARIQIGRISRFGLLEMSRQRLRSSLNRSIHTTCPRCNGQGSVRSVESLAHSIVHLIQEQAVKMHNIEIQVQVPVNVATYILNESRATLSYIEKETNVTIIIIPNEHLDSPNYSIKHVKVDPQSKSPASYKLVKFPKADVVASSKDTAVKTLIEPAVNEFLSPATALSDDIAEKKRSSATTSREGWFKRMVKAITDPQAPPKKIDQEPSKKTTMPLPKSAPPAAVEKPYTKNTRSPSTSAPRERRPQSSAPRTQNNYRQTQPKQQQQQQPQSPPPMVMPAIPPMPTTAVAAVVVEPMIMIEPPVIKEPAQIIIPLLTDPSPLETTQTALKQVRSVGNQTQAEIQAKVKEHLKEIRSETTTVAPYVGLGNDDQQLAQVKTKE